MTTNAPRDYLVRMSELPQLGEGRTMIGYAAVFNSPTEIESWEGHFVERIMPGAFRHTLAKSRNKVKVLFNHGIDPSIGNKPLGKPSVMREDERGLYVEVPLDETSYNEDIIASLRSGALDGMSFRFNVVADEWTEPERGLPERSITEVKLLEFGPVTFPAYEAALVGIRSAKDYEAWRRGATVPPPSLDSAAIGTESDRPPSAPVVVNPARRALLLLDIYQEGLIRDEPIR